MRRIEQQLRKYWHRQGKRGDDHESHVQEDLRRANLNKEEQGRADCADPTLRQAFEWSRTAEGFDYWGERDIRP